MQTEAVENYLKTICEIQQESGCVKTTALAQTFEGYGPLVGEFSIMGL